MTLSIGDAAPNVVLGRGDGDLVELSHYWSEKPVVVAFLRHFG